MKNTTWYPLLSTKIGGGGVLFGWDKYAQGVPSGHDFGVVGCLGAFWKKGRLLAYVPPLGTLAPPWFQANFENEGVGIYPTYHELSERSQCYGSIGKRN